MSDTIPSVWLWRDELICGDVKMMMPHYEQQGWFAKILDAFDIPQSARIQPECHVVALDCAIVAKSCCMGDVVYPPDVLTENPGIFCVWWIWRRPNAFRSQANLFAEGAVWKLVAPCNKRSRNHSRSYVISISKS